MRPISRDIYGNFSNKNLYSIRKELLEKIRKEKPEIQYKDTPRKTWFLHSDSITDDPKVIENYHSLLKLNEPSNKQELKDLIYSTKIEYDVWGIVFPIWGCLSLASLRDYYLVAREYYECNRTTNY
tara:strand:- start:1318 stop:1695 length:378 start_codon:yes stop_codon:yes gene_type:complete